jgi:hypothetical protein
LVWKEEVMRWCFVAVVWCVLTRSSTSSAGSSEFAMVKATAVGLTPSNEGFSKVEHLWVTAAPMGASLADVVQICLMASILRSVSPGTPILMYTRAIYSAGRSL